MTTVVVYKTDTKEVLAAIPMDGGDAVCRNDVEFQIYNGTEPIFTETPGGIVLAENKFMIKMEGNNNEKYDSWESHSQTVSFLGVEFPYGKIQMPGSYLYDTIKQSSHVRYLYYVINTEYSGVIYANLKDNTIEDGTPFIQADTIDEAVDYMVSSGTAGLVIFWVVWVILIGAAVFGFCYFDNKWLED